MRRGFFIAAGVAAVVLLWWQPWRRLFQQAATGGEAGVWQGQRPDSPYTGGYDSSSNWRAPTSPFPGSTQSFSTAGVSTNEIASERYTVTDPQNADPIAGDDSGDTATPDQTLDQGEAAMLASDAPPVLDSPAPPERAEPEFSTESTLTDMASEELSASEPVDTTTAGVGDTTESGESPTTVDDTTEDGERSTSTTTDAPDDLILIEGIGPKISTVLTAAGITTFTQLANTGAEQLTQIVRDAGITTANTSTWPDQARLAAEGKMDELYVLQGRIKNGKLTE